MTEEVFRTDSYASQCEAVVTAVDENGIQLDRTVFYPMGGGQPGDTGVLRNAAGAEVRITDTRKGDVPGQILHIPESQMPALKSGDKVTAVIDWDRRYRLMRVHTCLHLLCTVVAGGVTGGSVRDGSGRLDFDLPEPTLDKEHITSELNRLISENRSVRSRWITDEEMASKPELVRTMSVKPPSGRGRVRLVEIEGLDLQPCGGTHLASIGEIGKVRVGKIEKKGKHNRRVNVVLED
ncbi:MAG: alanyl-tRNA editing protein [Gammaproteobacteria bacterium]|nr:alanyl-tRNA editing protein [Gammaproteobacteria bacterium]